MDCDQVFMVLTRGPFPTGEPWDEEVEAHLETCGDCWRLAEALRPALEVFQEAVPPAESRELPGYWGDARPAAAVLSDLTKSSTRLATAGATLFRPPRRVAAADFSDHSRVSPQVIRAVLLASTVAATAVGAGLVWWAW